MNSMHEMMHRRFRKGTFMLGNRTQEHTIHLAMFACFAAALLIGTFADQTIAAVLYSPHNVIATLITTTGVFPFFSSGVLFLGVIFERLYDSGQRNPKRAALCITCAVAAFYTGFIGAAAFVSGDCLGGIIPSLDRNIPVILALTLLVELPIFGLGFKLAKRSDDALLLRRSLSLVIILLVAFLMLRFTKNIFNRPRYRTVVLGYEGVSFVPWYVRSPNPSALMARYGLDKNEFSSFPSGHAILAMSTIYILYSLAWLFPTLESKRRQLRLAGFLFAVAIMLTRVVLGAHYLSDVAMGAIIGLCLLLAYEVIQRRITEFDA